MKSTYFAGLGITLCAALGGCAGIGKQHPPTVMGDDHALSINENIPEKPQKSTPETLVAMGRFYASVKKQDVAEKMFNDALKADPKYVPAHISKAQLYFLQGSSDKGVAALQAGLNADPDAPLVWNEIAIYRAKKQDYAGAVDAAERALKRNGENPLILENLAGVLAVSGNPQRAFAVYCKIVTAAEAHYRVAGVLYKQGRVDESVNQLQMAVREDGTHQQAVKMLATLQPTAIAAAPPTDGVADRRRTGGVPAKSVWRRDSQVRPAGYEVDEQQPKEESVERANNVEADAAQEASAPEPPLLRRRALRSAVGQARAADPMN